MALIGKVEEFQENDNWIEYTERLEHYFTANEITDAGKKRAVLLSSCRAKTYKLIRNLVPPGKPTDKTFAELVNIVKNHLNPRPSTIVYRLKFNSRFRQPRETIHQYVAELRSLSEHCDFRDQLEDMIRDRLVCGVNDERIQRRLLAESRLDFKKALELATAMEIADKNTRDIQQGNSVEKPKESPVNRLNKEQGKKAAKECYRCGGKFHEAEKWRYKDEKCYRCQKKGHKASKCRVKLKTNQRNGKKQGNTYHMEATDSEEKLEEEDAAEYTMFHVAAKEREPYRVEINLNGF